jgi:hypothetical protein
LIAFQIAFSDMSLPPPAKNESGLANRGASGLNHPAERKMEAKPPSRKKDQSKMKILDGKVNKITNILVK